MYFCNKDKQNIYYYICCISYYNNITFWLFLQELKWIYSCFRDFSKLIF
ncbi:hypothetical protein HMPREF0072_1512 [Anaerococcus lactolyticus ATCC 51172]|uniref:Uncharacterized protein n=1 Tax=Anaerococcus lactolyticus ATCC 51172 TaxID=525254 RepID=C2BGP2_9FIRM|nr:hypothetical protein HMPREF0072_1512 [Anaerococcus lactolyticus ATCC 51172]